MALLFLLLACPFAAQAVDLNLKFEPGVAVPLGSPQSDRFGVGGAATLKGIVGFDGSYVSVAGGLTFIGLPAKSGLADSSLGTAWAPSLGVRIQAPRETEELRLQNPHAEETFYGAKPWIDGDALYVRTGGLNRAGFAAAVGVAFPVGQSRSFWLGPFARYVQILQGSRDGFDTGDSKTLIVGLSMETGTHPSREPAAEPAKAPVAAEPPPPAKVEVAAAPPPPPPAAPVAPPDRDGDGVPDDVDNCPDVAGPASNGGCPIYEKVVVKPDKLELKEKIQFAVGDGGIDPVSHPALDEVAQAMKDNKGFRVAIEGHASSEGLDENNQTLSKKRAQAVLEYLAGKGIARDRLVSTGFSSSRPIESNSTEAGRVANRRVEFVVHFIILKKGGR